MAAGSTTAITAAGPTTESKPLTRQVWYMSMARLAEARSADPDWQVGAVIVSTQRRGILGIGYNEMPGSKNKSFCWTKSDKDYMSDKHSFVCHAEMNAMSWSGCCFGGNWQGLEAYVTLHPCNNCCKLMIQSGVKKVFYLDYSAKKQKNLAFHSSEFIGAMSDQIIISHFHSKIDKVPSFKLPNAQAEPEQPFAGQRLELKNKDFFMALACLSSNRSKDDTKVGAVLVCKDERVIGIGYNGMPIGCEDSEMPFDTNAPARHCPAKICRATWDNNSSGPDKFHCMCHAEQNAVAFCSDSSKLKGSTLYTTTFPCNECAKLLVQVGVEKVWYGKCPTDTDKFKYRIEAAKKILEDKHEIFIPHWHYSIDLSLRPKPDE